MTFLKRPLCVLLILLITGFTTVAQTLQEWAQTVNWDGVSHWSKYIISNAKHMGPNALPVPFMGNGRVDNDNWVSATGHFHFSQGDNTRNIALYGNYSLARDLVSVDIAYVPVEYYRMSDAVKKERHVYYTHYNTSSARGDVYLNGTARLLKKWDKTVHLALRFGFRLPSSNRLEAARFTDNMGYYTDISFGKPLSSSLQWTGMLGIFVWQLTGDGHRQDDAFLFGTGLEWKKNNWKLQAYGAGYLGYLHNSGDKPVVIRMNAEKRLKRTGILLRLQQGLHDYDYSSLELGVKRFFGGAK